MCSHADQEQAISTESLRITLAEEEPEDLAAGTVVEIDLLGDGLTGYYTRLLIDPPSSDADGVMVAAELLDQCVSELGQARPAADTDHWTALVRRLSVAEHLVANHRTDGAGPLVWLLDQVRARLLSALRHGVRQDSIRSLIASTLEMTLDRCNDLVEDATATIRRTREHFETVTYGPLHAGDPQVKNLEDFSRGLLLASRLGLDLNTLEVGRCYQGDIVATIRGHKLSTPGGD